MIFRKATQSDIDAVACKSISHSMKRDPEVLDFVYALEDMGTVIGVGGLKLVTPTTAWVWMDWSEDARGRKVKGYRTAKEFLEVVMEKMCINRAMAAVDPTFDEAVRTVTHLGFVKESRMERFFGNDPADMYVRFAVRESNNGPSSGSNDSSRDRASGVRDVHAGPCSGG